MEITKVKDLLKLVNIGDEFHTNNAWCLLQDYDDKNITLILTPPKKPQTKIILAKKYRCTWFIDKIKKNGKEISL